VAVRDGRLAGFLVARSVAPNEVEVLNLAVAPELRRTGVGRALLGNLIDRRSVTIFLEVRASIRPPETSISPWDFRRLALGPNIMKTPSNRLLS